MIALGIDPRSVQLAAVFALVTGLEELALVRKRPGFGLQAAD